MAWVFLAAFSKIYSNIIIKESGDSLNTIWLQNKSNSKAKKSILAKDIKKPWAFHLASRKDILGVPEEFSIESISLKGWNIN